MFPSGISLRLGWRRVNSARAGLRCARQSSAYRHAASTPSVLS
jgi:hypothetical protein